MGRKSLAQLVLEDGPPCICVLVGDPKGRWRSQAMANSVEGKRLRSATTELGAGSIGDDLPIIAGLAVVEGWRFVHRRPHHVQSELLMEAARTYFPRRSGMTFLEHTILACARWKGAAYFPEDWQALPPYAFGHALLGRLQDECSDWVSCHLKAWNTRFGLAKPVVAWPLWLPLALGMASGKWHADISVLCQRHVGEMITAPVGPSALLLRHFMGLPVPVSPLESKRIEVKVVGDKNKSPGFPKAYTATKALPRLILASGLRDQRNVDSTIDAVASLEEGDGMSGVASVVRQNLGDGPRRTSLQRYRVRLDMAMMLWHRIANGIDEPRTFRYLTYDASPQGGVEIFCTAERVVTFSRDLANKVVIRRLPLVQLGHGRLGVADKAQALMHQCWLDYGPAPSDVQKANDVCRQNLSDMGHEFDIADLTKHFA